MSDVSKDTQNIFEKKPRARTRRTAVVSAATARRRSAVFSRVLSVPSYIVHFTKQLFVFLVACAIVYAVYLFVSGYVASREVTAHFQDNIERIQQHVMLPAGETPRMLLVDDTAKLPPYPFLKNTQKGDVIVVYQTAGTILVYRPSIDRVLSMNSFVPEGSSPAPVAPVTHAPTSTTTPVHK